MLERLTDMRFLSAFLILVYTTTAIAGNATFIKGPALIESLSTTATAGGTTTLTAASNTNQQFTGTLAQDVQLPNATTLSVGRAFQIMNRSTGALTLKNAGGSTLATIPAGKATRTTLIANGTSNGTWDYDTALSTAGPVITDANGTLSSEAALAVSRGGTGAATLTANNVVLGNGTSAVQFVAPGTSGNVLTSNGTTWTSAAIQPLELKNYSETVNAIGSTSGATTVDFSLGNVATMTLTGNATISFSNVPSSGKMGSVTMLITQGGAGSYTITWPACKKFAGGTLPTLSTTVGKTDVISCQTPDAGATCYCYTGGIGF
jgi:hypothetical protein